VNNDDVENLASGPVTPSDDGAEPTPPPPGGVRGPRRTNPPRYWNRIRSAPTCFECLDATEREIASGQCGVGCRGCYRIMTPLVEPFRRTTCSPACAMRERRRKPRPPVQSCAQCPTKFRRARACNLGWHYLYEYGSFLTIPLLGRP
jgi:hypothetical protein